MKNQSVTAMENLFQNALDRDSEAVQPMVVPEGCEVKCKVKGFPPRVECELVCK